MPKVRVYLTRIVATETAIMDIEIPDDINAEDEYAVENSFVQYLDFSDPDSIGELKEVQLNNCHEDWGYAFIELLDEDDN